MGRDVIDYLAIRNKEGKWCLLVESFTLSDSRGIIRYLYDHFPYLENEIEGFWENCDDRLWEMNEHYFEGKVFSVDQWLSLDIQKVTDGNKDLEKLFNDITKFLNLILECQNREDIAIVFENCV